MIDSNIMQKGYAGRHPFSDSIPIEIWKTFGGSRLVWSSSLLIEILKIRNMQTIREVFWYLGVRIKVMSNIVPIVVELEL